MPKIASLLVTSLNLGLTGPAMTLGMDAAMVPGPEEAGFGVYQAALTPDAETCHTQRILPGNVGSNPLFVAQITCLDALCETRDLLICPAGRPF